MTPPTRPSSLTIASIDGVRAIAVSLVVYSHAGDTTAFPPGLRLEAFGPLGTLGVRIFFILSGFLITHLLLREEAVRGAISLSRFYLRRSLRIFPAFYFYVAVMAIWQAYAGHPLPLGDMLAAVTYTLNYDRERVWLLGHAWSLGVEEQFYLLWPLTFAVLVPNRRRVAIVTLLLLGPVARVVTWRFFPDWELMIGETFPTIMDSLGTGVLLALVREELHQLAWYKRLLASPLCALLPVLVLGLNRANAEIVLGGWLLGETAVNLLIALAVDQVMTHPETRVGRFLNWRPVARLGQLSYSLYLWQQPFMQKAMPGLLTSFPVNVAGALGMAYFSHSVVEQPFLRLKDRIGRSVGRAAPE